MPLELKEPTLSQSLPALLAGDLAGAAEVTSPMRWRSFCLFVVLGLSITVLLGWAGASMRPKRVPLRGRTVDTELLAEGVGAFQSGDWKSAVRSFERVLSVQPGHARALDYLERIELTLHDADRLRRAEESLVAGQIIDAQRTALTIAPNSPLYAQAEALARSSREQREKSPGTAQGERVGAEAPSAASVQVALGEALALYEAGRFAEAEARALTLAAQATPQTRHELLEWAHDCRRFAQRFAKLPPDDLNLARHTSEAGDAIQLDERLSDGHFARKLRERMGRALSEHARVLVDSGDFLGGCGRAKEAEQFDPRSPESGPLTSRCDEEANRKIEQARVLERDRPVQALKLLRQALAISSRNSKAYRTATKGIEELSWSEER